MVKIGKLSASIIALLITVSSFVYSQKPSIQLSVNVKPIEVGQMVAFTVKSNIEAKEIDFKLPNCFISSGIANSTEHFMMGNSYSVNYNFINQGGFTEAGKYKVYFTLKDSKNKVYKSNELKIIVYNKGESKKHKDFEKSEDDISRNNLKDPIFGIINKSSKKLYLGEPLILQAKVYSKYNISNISNYDPYVLKGTFETFEIEKNNNIIPNREVYQGVNFTTLTLDKKLVFPNSSGNCIIKPFKILIQYGNSGFFDREYYLESNATFVEILPLPKGAPNDFNGGVGKFSMSSAFSKTNAKVGDILTFTINVSGKGNMHAISKPKINLPVNLTLYGDPEISEDIDYTTDGVEGDKIYKYFVKVISGGKVDMNPFSLSYFDPSLKKYITLKEKPMSLNLEGDDVASTDKYTDTLSIEGGEEVLSVPLSEEKLAVKETVPHSNVWIALLGGLVLFLGGVIFLLLRKRNTQTTINATAISEEPTQVYVSEVNPDSDLILAEAQQLANLGEYKAAYGIISKALTKNIHQKLGNPSEILSNDELTERMKANGISESIIEDYFWVIRTCQEAEYTIWDTHANWEEVVVKTKGIFRFFNL